MMLSLILLLAAQAAEPAPAPTADPMAEATAVVGAAAQTWSECLGNAMDAATDDDSLPDKAVDAIMAQCDAPRTALLDAHQRWLDADTSKDAKYKAKVRKEFVASTQAIRKQLLTALKQARRMMKDDD